MAGRWAPLIRLTAQASKDCLQAGVCRFRPDMLQPPAAKLDAAHTVVHVQTNLGRRAAGAPPGVGIGVWRLGPRRFNSLPVPNAFL